MIFLVSITLIIAGSLVALFQGDVSNSLQGIIGLVLLSIGFWLVFLNGYVDKVSGEEELRDSLGRIHFVWSSSPMNREDLYKVMVRYIRDSFDGVGKYEEDRADLITEKLNQLRFRRAEQLEEIDQEIDADFIDFLDSLSPSGGNFSVEMESRGHYLKLVQGLSEEKRRSEVNREELYSYLEHLGYEEFWGRYLVAVFVIVYLFVVYAAIGYGELIFPPVLLYAPYCLTFPIILAWLLSFGGRRSALEKLKKGLLQEGLRRR